MARWDTGRSVDRRLLVAISCVPTAVRSAMTQPDINPYPDEYARLTTVTERLAAQFEFTQFTETNKRIFDMAAHNEFGEAGFTIDIDWKEIYKNRCPPACGCRTSR